MRGKCTDRPHLIPRPYTGSGDDKVTLGWLYTLDLGDGTVPRVVRAEERRRSDCSCSLCNQRAAIYDIVQDYLYLARLSAFPAGSCPDAFSTVLAQCFDHLGCGPHFCKVLEGLDVHIMHSLRVNASPSERARRVPNEDDARHVDGKPVDCLRALLIRAVREIPVHTLPVRPQR